MGFWDFKAPGRSRRATAMLQSLRQEQLVGKQLPAPKEGHVERQYPTNAFPGPSAWIDGDHKLLLSSGGQAKLFDLSKDPAEKNDLASRNSKEVDSMRKSLRAWQGSVLNSLNGKDYLK